MMGVTVPVTDVGKAPEKRNRVDLIAQMGELALAKRMIELGARMQVLESELTLSKPALLNLYRSIKGESPKKGQVPFLVNYYFEWQVFSNASLFLNIFHKLEFISPKLSVAELLIKAYESYYSMVTASGQEPKLTFTRAWRLYKFEQVSMIVLKTCPACKGRMIFDPTRIHSNVPCMLCDPPNRNRRALKRKDESEQDE